MDSTQRRAGMLGRARGEVQELACPRKGQAGGTQQRIVPAAGSSPTLELWKSSWALGQRLGHPSCPPGTTATWPHFELCPADPHSPAMSGRGSPCWLVPLHNPAAACCLHTTIDTIFIPFLVVTGSSRVLGVEDFLPHAVM